MTTTLKQDEIIWQNEVLEIARQAGIDEWWDSGNEQREVLQEHLEAFAKLVEAHTRGQILKPDWDNYRQGLIDGAVSEREACAKLCDDLDDDLPDGLAGWQYGEAIRARGEA